MRIPLTVSKQKVFRLTLDCLYEDEHLAVIHKPAGLRTSGNFFKTVANALAQNLKPSNEIDAILPQPAHRLDFATTGALLIGKTRYALHMLNKAFEEQSVKKVYYAICIGNLDANGILNTPIDGKEATTYYKLIASVNSVRFGQLQLVALSPITGRRHQLRKHLYTIGCPILGDPEYHNPQHILKGKGLYLHAYSLEFEHPSTGEVLQIKDVLPTRFQKIFPDIELDSDFLIR